MTLHREPMANVDHAWLRMDDPTSLMMITGVITFAEPLSYEQVCQVIEERLLTFDRFKQRVSMSHSSLASACWEDDPHFDMEEHLRRATLPAPGDQQSLEQLASRLMSIPLNPIRPLWQFHLIEDYQGGSALVARLHHCIADGLALVAVLLSLTDAAQSSPLASPPSAPSPPTPQGRLVRAVRTAQSLTNDIVHESLVAARDPRRVIDIARLGGAGVARLVQILLRTPDPQTLFKGPLGIAKQAAWSQPIALQDVKAVARVMGGTINDVLLTAVAGGLRSYMIQRGEPVDGLNFHAVIPVNLRPLDEPLTLGNKFGLVFLTLPIGIADPVERLEALKAHMDALKNSPEALAIFGLLNVVGMGPVEIENLLVTIFGTKATGVMTNVPGPREQLSLAGSPLRDVMFWVPQSGRVGLGVSIISYNGKVLVGVATDSGLVPDPESIVAGYEQSFAEMMALLSMVRADGQVAPEVAAAPARVARCQATTRSGSRCRNRALAGAAYCRVHTPAD
ncbi:MAG: wax ester/triacylglycerol synthase family O-acyltransferase [Anaerolineae bacterium]|nr:wax ester/triacylglycerol synthase family O-acyltransferase [Anaerolineae bacterium]